MQSRESRKEKIFLHEKQKRVCVRARGCECVGTCYSFIYLLIDFETLWMGFFSPLNQWNIKLTSTELHKQTALGTVSRLQLRKVLILFNFNALVKCFSLLIKYSNNCKHWPSRIHRHLSSYHVSCLLRSEVKGAIWLVFDVRWTQHAFFHYYSYQPLCFLCSCEFEFNFIFISFSIFFKRRIREPTNFIGVA